MRLTVSADTKGGSIRTSSSWRIFVTCGIHADSLQIPGHHFSDKTIQTDFVDQGSEMNASAGSPHLLCKLVLYRFAGKNALFSFLCLGLDHEFLLSTLRILV
jgi:hypothetical protein